MCLSTIQFEKSCEDGEFETYGILSIDKPEGSVDTTNNSPVDPELATLLLDYQDIFEKPLIPPPSRPEDHSIAIKPGAPLPPVCGIGRLSEEKLSVLKTTIEELMEKVLRD